MEDKPVELSREAGGGLSLGFYLLAILPGGRNTVELFFGSGECGSI